VARSSLPPRTPGPGEDPLPQAWGPFRLQRRLHRDWTHVLYAAEEIATSASVAVMVCHGEDESRSVPPFAAVERRTDKLRMVRHESLLPVVAAGEVEGRSYVRVEPVEGTRLGVQRGLEPDVAWSDVCAGMAGIAEAVGALHEHGLLLMAMSASDIVRRPDGRFVQHSFGLACPLQAPLRDNEVLGRPLWMSPEMILGGRTKPGAANDIYQVGAVLYSLLTGQPPFQSDNLQDLIRSILSKRPRPPRRFNREIPRALDRLVLKCLAKEPNKRFSSAGELALALHELGAP
jgi:serine/threonine protein kinase